MFRRRNHSFLEVSNPTSAQDQGSDGEDKIEHALSGSLMHVLCYVIPVVRLQTKIFSNRSAVSAILLLSTRFHRYTLQNSRHPCIHCNLHHSKNRYYILLRMCSQCMDSFRCSRLRMDTLSVRNRIGLDSWLRSSNLEEFCQISLLARQL